MEVAPPAVADDVDLDEVVADSIDGIAFDSLHRESRVSRVKRPKPFGFGWLGHWECRWGCRLRQRLWHGH